MSETATTNPEVPKKVRKKFLIIIVLAVLLLAGGGTGGYFYFWRTSPASAAEGDTPEKKGSKKPHAKDDETASEEHDEEEKPGKSSKSSLPDDDGVTAIVELPPFIVNLADVEQARYLRMTVNLGIEGGEGGDEKPNQLFITRIRNAMLAVLGDKKSEEVLSAEGKAKLRKELLKAAQAASEEPHVQAIYITDFIVQL
jgi:flagellar FliL protein